jgi:hypothetical protein
LLMRWRPRSIAACALEGGVGGGEIGWFEHFREIITRGSLRGTMALAGARLSQSQLV